MIKNPTESGHYIIRDQDAATVAWFHKGGNCWQVIGDDSYYQLEEMNLTSYEKIELEPEPKL